MVTDEGMISERSSYKIQVCEGVIYIYTYQYFSGRYRGFYWKNASIEAAQARRAESYISVSHDSENHTDFVIFTTSANQLIIIFLFRFPDVSLVNK